MLATTSPETRWQVLHTQIAAVLTFAEARTDSPTTRELAAGYRRKLAKDAAWADAHTHDVTREAILSTLLGKWGVNGLWPAVCDVEAASRFHGAVREGRA